MRPYLYPGTAYNPEVFMKILDQRLKLWITVFKTILENDGADHIAGNVGQKGGRITGGC